MFQSELLGWACVAVVGALCLAGCAAGTGAKLPGERAIYEGVKASHAAAPTAEDYRVYQARIEQALRRELAFFYPRCLDMTHGGFIHALPADWEKRAPDERNKNIVYQARMTWTAAEVVKRRPELREEYLKYAAHGLAFLKDKMWDAQDGGFFWVVDEQGNPASLTDKHVYGNAFGIYSAATVFQATSDPDALELALKAFRWMDEHAHDAKNGGYYEALNRAGDVIVSADKSQRPERPTDLISNPYGFKSMDSHIHILEALTVLAQISPEPLVKQRLDEVFLIVRDKMVVQPGCLNVIFTPSWKATAMGDSFGHDIETAYLLWEADIVRHTNPSNKTRPVTRSLVDHALKVGWDDVYGGFYNDGFAFGKPHQRSKSWWTQAEGLNALMLMHETYGKQDPRYWRAFLHQWAMIDSLLIDPKDGGWYEQVLGDKLDSASKLNPWKASYHSVRAMLNVSDALGKLAGENSVNGTEQIK